MQSSFRYDLLLLLPINVRIRLNIRIAGDNWLSSDNGSLKKLVKLISESFFISVSLTSKEDLEKFENEAMSSFGFKTHKIINLISPKKSSRKKKEERSHFWSGLQFIESILWKKRIFFKLDHHVEVIPTIKWIQEFLTEEKKQIFKFSEIFLFEEINFQYIPEQDFSTPSFTKMSNSISHNMNIENSSTQSNFSDYFKSKQESKNKNNLSNNQLKPPQTAPLISHSRNNSINNRPQSPFNPANFRQSRVNFGIILLFIFLNELEEEFDKISADANLIKKNLKYLKEILSRLKSFGKFVILINYCMSKDKQLKNRRKNWEYTNLFNYFIFSLLNFAFSWHENFTSMEKSDKYLVVSVQLEDFICSISKFLLVLLEFTNLKEKPISFFFDLNERNFIDISNMPIYNLFFRIWTGDTGNPIINLSNWSKQKVRRN